ncbi:MAG: LysE family transporter [Chloroflexi bacterium]|nr:LysE family transporter [Chloroflexota bacterium]
MNSLTIFLRGFIIGLSIAAPVGPIGVLCIRRTLAEGRLNGFLSGLGAATADMLYGAVAAFGLTFITDLLVGQANWLRLVGGVFLLYIGIRTFIAKPAGHAAQASQNGVFGAYISTFFLTITNPMTILSFIAIFAGLRLGESNGDYVSAAFMVLGVFLGSAAWWLGLSFGVGLLREKFTPAWMVWVNRISGLVITTFGMIALFAK